MATGASQIAETTALLSDRHASIPGFSTHDENGGISGLEAGLKAPEEDATTWFEEAKLLSRYSWPLILTYTLQYSFNLVAILIVGHLGTKELGAISLAKWVNFIYLSATNANLHQYDRQHHGLSSI